MKEEWRSVKGYEGIYEVSNLGQVKSVARYSIQNHWLEDKILNQHDNGNGYMYVDFYKDSTKRKFYIHRLVAIAFIDNPDNLPQINHKDGITYNNNLDNLEWCTSKYNNNYGDHSKKQSMARKGKHKGKDHASSKKVVCLTTGKIFDCITDASRYYNIPNLRSHIGSFCNGNKMNFKYIGKLEDGTKLTWMYYDDYIKQGGIAV